MRITKISVKNLFGLFYHTIPFNVEERITIIHGPNGFGKTVLLKMVDSLFKQTYSIFRRIPFDEFRVDFDDGRYLLVKQDTSKSHGDKAKITIQGSNRDERSFTPEVSRQIAFPLGMIDEVIPELRRVDAEEWLDQRSGQVLSLDDILERYGENLPVGSQYRQHPKWLGDLQKEIKTHFVQTNRLLWRSAVRPTRRSYERDVMMAQSGTAVTQYSNELAERLQQTLARSAEISQPLDRTFPIRLVNQLSQGRKAKLTSEKLQKELRGLEMKRERLMAAGLMDKEEADVQIPEQAAMDDLTRIALSIYVKDVERKLRVFDDVLEKVELLQKTINDRCAYSYKKMIIDRERGFIFQTKDGTPLSADALSSGEQHELVLFYELLFRTEPGSLILIDEPELSLHIAWQQVFLKDLSAITGLADIDVLIATHSADIIYDKWNLAVELQRPEQ